MNNEFSVFNYIADGMDSVQLNNILNNNLRNIKNQNNNNNNNQINNNNDDDYLKNIEDGVDSVQLNNILNNNLRNNNNKNNKNKHHNQQFESIEEKSEEYSVFNNISEESKIDLIHFNCVQNLFMKASYENKQEEKLKLLNDVIEYEKEYLTTKIWQFKAFEQRLLIFINNLDKTQVIYTLQQLLNLKYDVDESVSKKMMENVIGILNNPNVINYSRPVVSAVVKMLHENEGTNEYYKQLLNFLQQNQFFFMEDEKKALFPIDLFKPFIVDINIFNLEVHVIGNEEKQKTIGNQVYYPPIGWTAYEFDIYLKYDNGNSKWLKCEGKPGEWAIAYHGVARNQNNNNILKAIDNIYKDNLKPGVNQGCRDYNNINPNTKMKYPKCGVGVYVTPNIATAEYYAGRLNINGKVYLCVLQFRINPEHLRIASGQNDYWVCEGSVNGVRPYRLLIKETR